MRMCILIRAALSFLEGFALVHINLGSCQSSPDQLTNVLTSGGKSFHIFRRQTWRDRVCCLQQPPVLSRTLCVCVKMFWILKRAEFDCNPWVGEIEVDMSLQKFLLPLWMSSICITFKRTSVNCYLFFHLGGWSFFLWIIENASGLCRSIFCRNSVRLACAAS